jgi:FkbM family methyltransferase
MNTYSSDVGILVRRVLRRMGLSMRLASLFYGRGYEQKYQDKLLSCLRIGDVVWDIGANEGHYAVEFARRVGDEGLVVAFEPNPNILPRLHEKVRPFKQVRVEAFALGDCSKTVLFSVSSDLRGLYSRIDETAGSVKVQVKSGDELIERLNLPVPNVVKIDVEGYETEVIKGMTRLLDHAALRVVAVEVHFGLLDERGLSPQCVLDALRQHHFVIRWTDPSHIIATRR